MTPESRLILVASGEANLCYLRFVASGRVWQTTGILYDEAYPFLEEQTQPPSVPHFPPVMSRSILDTLSVEDPPVEVNP